jgi:2-polyprenyl-3-methyl-5-hydroxy-6-metoxy-1,4-benzoquinol methylase
MIDFSSRSQQPERMDDPECDEASLYRTLDQFRTVNRLFSRYRTLLRKTVLRDMEPGRNYHLVDVGAGGCDIALWLLKEARSRGLHLRITALEPDPRIFRYVRDRIGEVPGLHLVQESGEHLAAHAPFDYVFANHVLHHLSGEEIHALLHQTSQAAKRGFVFSDLLRSRWSYLGFSLAALPFRNSFIREDGLISIQRGFHAEELRKLTDPVPAHVRTAFPGRINIISETLTNS